jgi:hypothetical protein
VPYLVAGALVLVTGAPQGRGESETQITDAFSIRHRMR